MTAQPRKLLQTSHAERIDQPDFNHAAFRSQAEGLAQLVADLIIGEDRPRGTTETPQPIHCVVRGFGITNPSGKIVQVDGGIAVVGWRDENKVKHGVLVSDSIAKTLDVSTYAAATTFGVFVRAQFEDSDFVDRIFWNSAAATPVEVVKNVATRFTEAWEMKIAVSSPGDEWLKLGDVVPDTLNGTGAGITDRRNFLFEGRADATPTYVITDQDWGGGSVSTGDRSVDRATYGNFGFFRWIRAVNRQIQDIVGLGGTMVAAIGSNQSLVALAASRLEIAGRGGLAGAARMTGHLDPTSDATLDLGDDDAATPRRWRDAFIGQMLRIGGSRLNSAVNARLARIDIPVRNDAAASMYTRLLTSLNASALGSAMNIYRLPSGVTVLAMNAVWDGTNWTLQDPGLVANAIQLGFELVTFAQHDPANGVSWPDTFVIGGSSWNIKAQLSFATGALSVTTRVPIVKAQAMIDFNLSVVTPVSSINIATVAINATSQRLEVTFPAGILGSGGYTALAWYTEGALAGHTLHQMTATQTSTFVTFESRTPAGAIANQLNTYIGRIVLAVFGS